MKAKIGDLLTRRGEVVKLNEKYECVLSSAVWYNTRTTASLFRKGESPSEHDNIDWFALPQNVEITAHGGAFGNEMFDCVVDF